MLNIYSLLLQSWFWYKNISSFNNLYNWRATHISFLWLYSTPHFCKPAVLAEEIERERIFQEWWDSHCDNKYKRHKQLEWSASCSCPLTLSLLHSHQSQENSRKSHNAFWDFCFSWVWVFICWYFCGMELFFYLKNRILMNIGFLYFRYSVLEP